MFRPELFRLLVPPALFTIALANPFRSSKAPDDDHAKATAATTVPVAHPAVKGCESVAVEGAAGRQAASLAHRLRKAPDDHAVRTVTEGLTGSAADLTERATAPCAK